MTDSELIAAFENSELAASAFTHENHVRVAWAMLKECSLLDALDRFTKALRAFTRKHGAEAKYSETVTWFFMLLIAERQSKRPTPTFKQFAEVNPDLIKGAGHLLLSHYHEETLNGELARTTFVLPDKFVA